jgi:hypothetical protein
MTFRRGIGRTCSGWTAPDRPHLPLSGAAGGRTLGRRAPGNLGHGGGQPIRRHG